VRQLKLSDFWDGCDMTQNSQIEVNLDFADFDGRAADGAVVAEFRQSIRDLEGKPLQGQTHGLTDKMVGHVFRLHDGKVTRLDIQEVP
jgi:CxxC motif-containing protein (DUF1111 family)